MMSTATRRTKTRGRLWAISVSALGTLGVLAGITAANAADGPPEGSTSAKPIVIIGSSIPTEARSVRVTVTDAPSTETRAKKCLEVSPGGNSEDVNVGLEVLAEPDGDEFVSYGTFQSSGCEVGESNKFLLTQGNQTKDENPGDPDTFGLNLN
jgi:hypothetical protein